jgi:phage terminase large subunit GpA-like protein
MADPYSKAFAAGLAPDPVLKVSEWADRYRVLSGRNAVPGKWRTSRVPYLREIMDSMSARSGVEVTVVMAAAQVAKTEALLNFIGYSIDQVPAATLVVLPTVELARRFSRQRLDPMIEECPRLSARVRPARSRDSGNTVMSKEYPGGMLNLAGANSAAGLRSMPARNLLMDEVDAFPLNVEGEGDPVELARARTRTFANARVVLTSTPTIRGRSRIEAAFLQTDQRRYFVPCPHCEHYQVLTWSNIKYEDSDPDTAQYLCASCAALIGEEHKPRMLAKGEWRATADPVAGVRGYHISALYTAPGLGLSWAGCVREWLRAKEEGSDRLRVVVNTIFGETWVEKGEVPEWERLYRRREKYPAGVVPRGALLLTAGVDVQGDRLEIEIVGWARRHETWSVDYVVIPGDTSSEEPWNALEELLARAWPREGGGELPVRLAAIDSGFRTSVVYSWTRARAAGRVIATKGREHLVQLVGAPSVVDITGKGKRLKRRGARVWPIGTSMAKAELYAWLRREPPLNEGEPVPHGLCHFPEFPEEYFKGLCSEHMVGIRKRDGTVHYEWQKLRERNEPLDCRVLNRAAAYVVGVDRWAEESWVAVEAELGVVTQAPEVQPESVAPAAPDKPDPATEGRKPRTKGIWSRWGGRRLS